MSCVCDPLDAGLGGTNCTLGPGGAETVYLTDECNFTAVYQDDDPKTGVIIDFTVVGSGSPVFYEFRGKKNTILANAAAVGTDGSGSKFWRQTLGFEVTGMTAATAVVAQKLINGSYTAIVKSKQKNTNGQARLFAYGVVTGLTATDTLAVNLGQNETDSAGLTGEMTAATDWPVYEIIPDATTYPGGVNEFLAAMTGA